MLPISATDRVRFTPPGYEGVEKPPVYIIEVPDLKGKARFDRRMQEEGCNFPTDAQMRKALEDGIRAVVEESQQQELLDLTDRYWAACAEGEIPEGLAEQFRDMAGQLESVVPEMSKLSAARSYWMDMLPIVACECFLKGVENVDVRFRLTGNMVSPETLRALDQAHVVAIGWKAQVLMVLTPEQRKNSASPLQSPTSQQPTTAAKNHPKDATGKSSGSDTTETPATA